MYHTLESTSLGIFPWTLYPWTLDIPNGPTSVVKCYTLMNEFPMDFLYPGTIAMCLWMDYEQTVLNPHFLNGLNAPETCYLQAALALDYK